MFKEIDMKKVTDSVIFRTFCIVAIAAAAIAGVLLLDMVI